MTARTTLQALNAADRVEFVERLAGIYEHSPWVAERAWTRRPFADRTALERALRDAVLSAAHDEQLELIRRHPRLGLRGPMAERSHSEQRGAGLSTLAGDERAQLAALNERYKQRFGFPFVVAVKGLGLREIVDNCRARLENDPATEHDESLRQIFRIAAFRLADAVT
jgi:OHCU decarboxylase